MESRYAAGSCEGKRTPLDVYEEHAQYVTGLQLPYSGPTLLPGTRAEHARLLTYAASTVQNNSLVRRSCSGQVRLSDEVGKAGLTRG